MHRFLGEGRFMDEKQTSLNGLTHEEVKQRVQSGKVNKAVDDQIGSFRNRACPPVGHAARYEEHRSFGACQCPLRR